MLSQTAKLQFRGNTASRMLPIRPMALLTLAMLLISAVGGLAADTAIATAPSPAITNELQKIEADDDAAQAQVDKWTRENNDLRARGSGVSDAELETRVANRFEPVRRAYEQYLLRHPEDAQAHLVFGSFLNDRQDEHGAQVEWEKSLALDPRNPAVYNNLAGRYSESGPVEKVFAYFAKAIELGPNEPVYYHNFADTLYVLRSRAAAHYGITEQQVYGKALLMYSNALRLDPQNFAFARDLAQTYYSLKPFPPEEALAAWTNAWRIARQESDREDASVHLARVKMLAGRFAEARAQLQAVTNQASLQAKTALLHNIAEREKDRPPGQPVSARAPSP